MAAYRPVDAGRLPVHLHQLRTQRSVTSMGGLYLFTGRKSPNSSSSTYPLGL